MESWSRWPTAFLIHQVKNVRSETFTCGLVWWMNVSFEAVTNQRLVCVEVSMLRNIYEVGAQSVNYRSFASFKCSKVGALVCSFLWTKTVPVVAWPEQSVLDIGFYVLNNIHFSILYSSSSSMYAAVYAEPLDPGHTLPFILAETVCTRLFREILFFIVALFVCWSTGRGSEKKAHPVS